MSRQVAFAHDSIRSPSLCSCIIVHATGLHCAAVIYTGLFSLKQVDAGNNEKLKILNMGQHILDSLDTPQQLYQVCPCWCLLSSAH